MALPFLLSLGLPALGAATGGLGLGLGAASLAGIGAGLGSFLQTGDVGKGIQTGLIAGLGGKLMSSATNALGGAGAQASTQALTTEGLPAATGSKLLNATLGKDLLAKKLVTGLGETTVAGALGAAGSGFGAGVIADAMNPQTMKLPSSEKVDVPPPMPRIRSYQPKRDMDSTAEEEMITYYNPVKRMRGGGILGLGGASQLMPQYGHPAFSTLASALAQGINSTTNEKVRPFVQEVEAMAKDRFGPDIFQQQLLAARPNPNFGYAIEENMLFNTPDSNNGFDIASALRQPLFNRAQPNFNPDSIRNPGSLLQGGMPATLQGFAEGGEVEAPEDMNEKDVIVEAVKAIKGLSDAPEIALGIFLDKYGQEALEDLVEKVQSGVLDDTIERFASGDKGMVEGMGDGSGEDDMIPASLDGEQDVLLTEGEFVMRQPTTKAIQDEFGSEFLDIINQSEEKAPEKIREMVGVES